MKIITFYCPVLDAECVHRFDSEMCAHCEALIYSEREV